MRKIIKGATWLGSAGTLATILNFVQGIIITRSLGAEQYGILILVMTYARTIRQLIDARNFEAVVKFIPQFRERGEISKATAVLKMLYLLDAAIAVLSVLVVFVTAQLAARIFINNVYAADLIKFYAIVSAIDFANEVSSAVMRLGNQYRHLFYIEVSLTLFQTIVLLFLWLSGANILSVLAVLLISTLCGTILTQFVALKTIRAMGLTAWRSSPIWLLRGHFRELFRFIFLSYMTANSRLITSKADILILGRFTNPAIVAYYSLANRVVDAIISQMGSFSEATYPQMSEYIARGELLRVERLQKWLTVLLLALTIPVCLVGGIVLKWVISVVFGTEYLPAIPLMQILIWTLIWMPLSWIPGFLLATGRAHMVTLFAFIDALIFIILLIALTPIYGAPGAALAGVLRMVIWIGMAGGYIIYLYRVGWSRSSHLSKVG